MIQVVPTGMDGAMGTAVREVAEGSDDCVTNWGVSGSSERPGALAPQLPDLFAERGGDVLVDFSGPESSVAYVEACAEIGVPCVVGTTGFDEEREERLRAASESVPVLKAANFSRGVHVLSALVHEVAATLPEYDIELTETHHNRKRDAPSGTANRLLEEIESARETTGRVHGREGEAPRETGEVGVHARRAGTITGEHEVLLAGGGEELRLTHRAESRRVFAEGALDAAVWLAPRSPGWYDFSDLMTDESV